MGNRMEELRKGILDGGNPGGVSTSDRVIRWSIEGEERDFSGLTKKEKRSLRRRKRLQNTEDVPGQLNFPGLELAGLEQDSYGLWVPLAESSPEKPEDPGLTHPITPSRFAKVRGIVSAIVRRLGFKR